MTEGNSKRKVHIEIDPEGPEEIIIRCRKLDNEIIDLQSMIESSDRRPDTKMILEIADEEHLVDLSDILFFESYDKKVNAHTKDRIYTTDQKLYELEDILPSGFMRVSKSCILNLANVVWLKKEITGQCKIGF